MISGKHDHEDGTITHWQYDPERGIFSALLGGTWRGYRWEAGRDPDDADVAALIQELKALG